MREILEFVSLRGAVNVEYVPGEHMVYWDGIRPPVHTHGRQHAVVCPRQDFPGLLLTNRPVASPYVPQLTNRLAG
jgi:hypothetical protein